MLSLPARFKRTVRASSSTTETDSASGSTSTRLRTSTGVATLAPPMESTAVPSGTWLAADGSVVAVTIGLPVAGWHAVSMPSRFPSLRTLTVVRTSLDWRACPSPAVAW